MWEKYCCLRRVFQHLRIVWIQLLNLLSFNYLTGKTVQCCTVYFPGITVLGLSQAHCRAGSADSTAGSGSHGETGKRCQESSRFDEDHGWGRCFGRLSTSSRITVSQRTLDQHFDDSQPTNSQQSTDSWPTDDWQSRLRIVLHFYQYKNSNNSPNKCRAVITDFQLIVPRFLTSLTL